MIQALTILSTHWASITKGEDSFHTMAVLKLEVQQLSSGLFQVSTPISLTDPFKFSAVSPKICIGGKRKGWRYILKNGEYAPLKILFHFDSTVSYLMPSPESIIKREIHRVTSSSEPQLFCAITLRAKKQSFYP